MATFNVQETPCLFRNSFKVGLICSGSQTLLAEDILKETGKVQDYGKNIYFLTLFLGLPAWRNTKTAIVVAVPDIAKIAGTSARGSPNFVASPLPVSRLKKTFFSSSTSST